MQITQTLNEAAYNCHQEAFKKDNEGHEGRHQSPCEKKMLLNVIIIIIIIINIIINIIITTIIIIYYCS